MTEAHEAIVKVIAIGVALFGLWLAQRSRWARLGGRRPALLAGLTALGVLSYVNFGAFHTDGTPLHIWDQFHYVLGSKYFPELGYDGLYVATAQAFEERDPAYVLPPRMRDLRSGQIVPTASLAQFTRDVRGRFSNQRWEMFKSDATHFYIRSDIFLDNGYLGTPADAAVERLFTAHLPFRQRTAMFFAMLDVCLLVLAGLAIYRVFGLEALAAASLIFGLGYCSRFYWVGGAFLRHDWLAALVFCAAALERRRGRLAGAALAYAVCARIYPVLMLLPLGVFALSRRKQPAPVAWGNFALGFVSVGALLVIAGCLIGHGPGIWLESAEKLLQHGGIVAPNAIGLRIPLSATVANLRGDLLDPSTLYAYADISSDFAQTARKNLVLIIVATALFLGLALRAAWYSRNAVTAFVIGIAVMYALTTPMCYYGTYFALLALVQPARSAAIFLMSNALMYVVVGAVFALSAQGIIRLNGAAVYVPVSVLLLLTLIAWLFNVSKGVSVRSRPDC
jgi:hypothetical protein